MKIGVLTLPLHINYGGILQAYALQTVLERMGHQVVVIDKPYKPRSPSVIMYVKRFIKKITGYPSILNFEKYVESSYPIISSNITPFLDKYLHRRIVANLNDLKETDFDALIVGSDQIWRKLYYPEIENAYFSFAENWKRLKRIAYAPSFGTGEWEYTSSETKRCAELIKKFNAISVREDSAVSICEKYYNVKATHVLDPTMILSLDDYIKLIEDSNTPKSKGSLLNYVLDKSPTIDIIIKKMTEESGLKPFSVIGNSLSPLMKPDQCIQPSIESWLRGFYDAELVITDSFHACVFAMIFNKPFIVIGNKKRGLARFNSLLKVFDQEFRLIDNWEEYKKQDINIRNKPNVYDVMRKEQLVSLLFLNDALR